MDVNSLKINLGQLERFNEQAIANKTVIRSSVVNILGLVEEEREELQDFIEEVDKVVRETRRQCKV